MKIFNTTKMRIDELVHPSYDTDVMSDIVAGDDMITWDDDREMQSASQETIDWWIDYVTAEAKFLAAQAELLDQISPTNRDMFLKELDDQMHVDMEDQPKIGLFVVHEWVKKLGVTL